MCRTADFTAEIVDASLPATTIATAADVAAVVIVESVRWKIFMGAHDIIILRLFSCLWQIGKFFFYDFSKS